MVNNPRSASRCLWTPRAPASRSRDVNATNFRYLNHFLTDKTRRSRSRSTTAIQRKYQGIPWVNSIAADSSGKAYYSMQEPDPQRPR